MTPPTDISSAIPDLQDFPRPNVAVDVAVLSVVQVENRPQLVALAHVREGGWAEGQWALPGRMLRPGDTLAQTAQDAVRLKLGLDEISLRQLRVFDEPDRDPRGWVLSVAHVGTVPAHVAQWSRNNPHVNYIFAYQDEFEFPNNQSTLPFEQREILREAVKDLRLKYSVLPDPGNMLEDGFTMLQLREIHEAVLGEEIQPDTFRREMMPNLEPTGRQSSGSVGKPAMTYRRVHSQSSSVRSPSRSSRGARRYNPEDVL